MSTLTRFSAIPYTGPAPTNRQPYIPRDAAQMDARGEEIAGKLNNPAVAQERGQDLPTFIVDREQIVPVLQVLRDHPDLQFSLPLDLWGADYPRREKRFD
ncbi:MAG TPA: hypothetical protein VF980_10180, partial [Thermoanaerobaculia bacterium]